MKAVKYADPRHAEVVAKMKALTDTTKVTNLKEDANAFYGDCMTSNGRGHGYTLAHPNFRLSK